MTLDELVGAYVKLRQKKATIKAEFDDKVKPVDAAMDRIESALLDIFNQTGVESVKTPHGTAYTTTRTSAKVADWDSFIAYIKAHDAFELLERRAGKDAVEQFKAANDELPPGISWTAVRAINFRQS